MAGLLDHGPAQLLRGSAGAGAFGSAVRLVAIGLAAPLAVVAGAREAVRDAGGDDAREEVRHGWVG